MKQWDIWLLDQSASRIATDPSQPIPEDHRSRRFYVVMSPNAHLAAGAHATVVPIKTKRGNPAYSIPIHSNKTNSLDHASYIWCHQIYTVPQRFLAAFNGHVDSHLREHVSTALKRYLPQA